MIATSILKQQKFRINNDENPGMHSDSYWYMDLWNKGIISYIHTGIKCRHENMDWMVVRQKRANQFIKTGVKFDKFMEQFNGGVRNG